MVWHIVLLLNSLLWLATDSQSNFSLAKPGCDDKCGNVTIPYPFGMGSNCYMNEWFSITCGNSTNPPTPFLSRYNTGVLDIELKPRIVRINSSTPHSCGRYTTESINLGDNPHLNYSETSNRFNAFGCDVTASISNNNEVIGGCVSICNQESNSSYRRSGCFGIDCCQAMIPYGLKNFTVTVNGTTPDNVNSTCNYAFLADRDWDPSQFLYPSNNVPMEVPVVLDWRFSENETCQICGSGANCSRDQIQNLVSCSCGSDLQGNPYLLEGCAGVSSILAHAYSAYRLSAFIGVVIAIFLFLLFLGLWSLRKLMQRRKRIKRKEKFFKRNGGLLLQQKVSSNDGNIQTTKLFTSTELKIATDRYNENRILGRGGQGTVYKGMLTDGRIVAVKKSKIANEDQVEQFINEVVILSQIDHRNIMKLLGCCLETEVPLLVYEFIPNGTLSHLIRDQSEEFPLSWEVRLRIATEVASAISYLHSAASIPIYHRDIKSDNILLDEKFRAKVSDFGTSKSVAIDQSHLTTQVKGTFGYLDPEYFQSNQFTEKSDVYSFGVVLVELLTGKKPISSIGSEEKRSLVSYFISSMEENRLLDILDHRVAKEGGKEELMAVASLAKRCLSMEGRNRPSMREVVMELEGIRMSNGYLPTQRKQDGLVVEEPTEHWEFSSILTGSPITTCTSDVEPLMINTI